jgi:hypothetical protein
MHTNRSSWLCLTAAGSSSILSSVFRIAPQMQQKFQVGDPRDCQALLLQQLVTQLMTFHNTTVEPAPANLNLASNGCLAEPALGGLLPLLLAAAVAGCLLLLLLRVAAA